MLMTQTGYLIADYYCRPVFFFSSSACYTFLPNCKLNGQSPIGIHLEETMAKRYYKIVPSGHYTAVSFEETSTVPAVVSNCKFTKEWWFLLGDRVAEWKRLMVKMENKPTGVVTRKQNKDEQIVIDLKNDIEDTKDAEKNISQEVVRKRRQTLVTQKPQKTVRNKRRKNDMKNDSLRSDFNTENKSDRHSHYTFDGKPIGDREFTKEKFEKLRDKRLN